MNVPNRRPPRPHSCSRSRSPLRQRAAAKPSQVINANSRMKIVRATQFTSATALLPIFFFYPRLLTAARLCGKADLLILGRKVDDRGQDRSDDDPQELIPIKERNAGPRWLDRVVEGWPEHRDELDRKQQIPPAPGRAGAVPIGIWLIHLAALTPHETVDRCSTPIERREFRLIKDLDAADVDAADLDAAHLDPHTWIRTLGSARLDP